MKYLVSWRWIKGSCLVLLQEAMIEKGRIQDECGYQYNHYYDGDPIPCHEKTCPLVKGLKEER